MSEFDEILGLGLVESTKTEKVSEDVKKLIGARENARSKGDFITADEIRSKLRDEFGIILEDTKDGVKWKKVGHPPQPKSSI